MQDFTHTTEDLDNFRKGLESLLNQYSMEDYSDTPDFLVASFLTSCLVAFDNAINSHEQHIKAWSQVRGDMMGTVLSGFEKAVDMRYALRSKDSEDDKS